MINVSQDARKKESEKVQFSGNIQTNLDHSSNLVFSTAEIPIPGASFANKFYDLGLGLWPSSPIEKLEPSEISMEQEELRQIMGLNATSTNEVAKEGIFARKLVLSRSFMVSIGLSNLRSFRKMSKNRHR